MSRNTTHTSQRDCLIAVLNNDADLRRFSDEGWYRIPARAIGRQLAHEAVMESTALALYQTASIRDGLPGAIELWGEIEERLVAPRRIIIPDEPHHPAADETYHVMRLKNVERLEQPILAHRPRRVTFIRTTRERLLRASDLNELVIGSPAEERLWDGLRKEEGGNIERRYFMRSQGVVMELDFALFRAGDGLGLHCCEDDRTATDGPDVPEAWSILRFSPARLDTDLDACLREISAMADRMAHERSVATPASLAQRR